jgi:hypothetical protein
MSATRTRAQGEIMQNFFYKLRWHWRTLKYRWPPFKHCEHCKKFVFSFSPHVIFCCDEHYQEWLPF